MAAAIRAAMLAKRHARMQTVADGEGDGLHEDRGASEGGDSGRVNVVKGRPGNGGGDSYDSSPEAGELLTRIILMGRHHQCCIISAANMDFARCMMWVTMML